jgi:hypothetical protein
MLCLLTSDIPRAFDDMELVEVLFDEGTVDVWYSKRQCYDGLYS